MRIKKLIAVMLVFITVVSLFASCIKPFEKKTDDGTDRSLINVVEKNVLVIGYTDIRYPLFYKEGKGDLEGFEIDIIRELCKRLVVECEFRQIEESRIKEKLELGEIDIAWGNITNDKFEGMEKSPPIFEASTPVFIVTEKNKDILKSAETLKEKNVGYIGLTKSGNDANAQEGFVQSLASYKAYESINLLQTALLRSEVDAVVMDDLTAMHSMYKQPQTYSLISQGLKQSQDGFVIVFNSKKKLLNDKIKLLLDLLLKNQTLDYFSRQWFDSSDVITLPELDENKLFNEGDISSYVTVEIAQAKKIADEQELLSSMQASQQAQLQSQAQTSAQAESRNGVSSK